MPLRNDKDESAPPLTRKPAVFEPERHVEWQEMMEDGKKPERRTNVAAILQAVVCGAFGLYLAAVVPGALTILSGAAAFGLLGMVRPHHDEATVLVNEPGTMLWLARFVVMCIVVFVGHWLLPEWSKAVTDFGTYGFSVRSQWPIPVILIKLLLAGFWACAVFGLVLGLAYFFAIRILVLVVVLVRRPLVALTMIPAVWISRTFFRGIFESQEIVPGHPFQGTETGAGELAGQAEVPEQAIMISRWAASASLFIACLATAIISKVIWPFVSPIALLLAPLAGKKSALERFAIRQHLSRVAAVALWSSVVIIALAILKFVSFLNRDVLADWISRHAAGELEILWGSYEIHAWQLASAISAILFLSAVAMIDRWYADRTYATTASGRRKTLAIAQMFLRTRTVLALYGFVCFACLCHPWLRSNVFRHINVVVLDLK